MSSLRTAIDANLLIGAWSGTSTLLAAALAVLEDQRRTLIVSDALWLEVMPKAIYHRQEQERAFYEAVFTRAEQVLWSTALVESAKRLAQTYGLAAMDAIHLAVAISARADEFISGEKPEKPIFRVTEITTRSLWGDRS